MKIRVHRPVVSRKIGTCTTIDHAFPICLRGEPCYCERRRWGFEPTRKALQMVDEKGRLFRNVWRTIRLSPPTSERSTWVAILALNDCGHVATKVSPLQMRWARVRCRLCEHRFVELNKKAERRAARKVKRLARQKRLEEKLRARQKITIRLKKKR